jgi:serine/threonine protein kinase
MLFQLRANGPKRSLYIAYVCVLSPLLEPLRSLVGGLLNLPARKRLLVLLPVGICCLLFLALLRLWPLVGLLSILALLVWFGRTMYRRLRPAWRFRYWRARRDALLRTGKDGYVLTIDELGLPVEGLAALRAELQQSPVVTIADIDQDGYFLPRFGPVPGVVSATQEDFMERKRYSLQLVALENKVGVKKSYGQRRAGFLNELEVLHSLAGCCNVPAILDVDFAELSIVISFIPGAVIREELAAKGAKLRNRDVDDNPSFRQLSGTEQRSRRVTEARRVLSDVLDQEMVEDIFAELQKLHRAGVLVNDIKYGNVIIERSSGQPYLIDFDHARYHGHRRGLRWQAKRDDEIERFNLVFAAEKPTRTRLLQQIEGFSARNLDARHRSVDFGHGLATGAIWAVQFGEGCWHYILKPNLPDLSGMRVLDLGCKNALFLLQTLRHGAGQGVGIEHDERWIAEAKFVREGFEWADSTSYNLEVVSAPLEELATLDLGKFDLVTALGTLHFLSSESLESVVHRVSRLTDCFVVQCDTDPEGVPPDARARARVEYNVNLLERHGFRIERVIAPAGYERPLIIGTKRTSEC